SPLFLDTNDKVSHNQYRAFATAEWDITDSNMLNFGALLEKHDFGETALSPRISFSHAFTPQQKLRIGVSQALRGPFIFEAYGKKVYRQDLTTGGLPLPVPPYPYNSLYEQVLQGNRDLKNEKIISREIAYFGEFLNSALLFNGRIFYDTISNYIDTLREPAPPEDNVNDVLGDPSSPNTMLVFRNPINSTTKGIEAELDYHIDPSLRLIASGAVISIDSNSDATSRSAPHHSYSFLLNKQFRGTYSTSLGYYFVENFKWMDARGTKDYKILDFRISRSFRSSWSNGSISLVLKNLLDDYSDYNAQPRNSTAPQVIQSTLGYIDFRMNF
ncbi:MAG TPA: TonB-dependent receptor, partial [Gammaproteobacteria bacterium]|nr:TonB-dependent receptor [Gammaproteobacteria bacterium]